MLELKPNSPELIAEIDDKQTKINGTNAQIVFKNGSYIKVVTAGDSSRGNRANILVLDEFRMIKKDIVDTILRKFLTQRRMPRYDSLTKEQKMKEYAKEKNMTMYLSSAFWSDSWAYAKCQDTFKFMVDDTKRQFVCGLPYQLSIEEGLLDADTVADEMAEADFSEIKHSMEYEALFYGASTDSFFNFESVSKTRKIKYPMLPDKLSFKLGNSSCVRIPQKQNGEVRILSADTALMASTKHNNDAAAIFINQMSMTKAGRYVSNIVYSENHEGLLTDELALVIRKLYEEFQCDYIVLDCQGNGLGVYDALIKDMVDAETGEIYPALSCFNDKAMAARCPYVDAKKVIYSVKACLEFNSQCALMLRDGFMNGRIRLLENEYDAEEVLGDIKQYQTLSPAEKVQIQMPYINTTLLVDELTKLQHDESSGKVRIYERSGMRKDRYSSLAYNYYVALQIENKISKKSVMSSSANDWFVVKAPKKWR